MTWTHPTLTTARDASLAAVRVLLLNALLLLEGVAHSSAAQHLELTFCLHSPSHISNTLHSCIVCELPHCHLYYCFHQHSVTHALFLPFPPPHPPSPAGFPLHHHIPQLHASTDSASYSSISPTDEDCGQGSSVKFINS